MSSNDALTDEITRAREQQGDDWQQRLDEQYDGRFYERLQEAWGNEWSTRLDIMLQGNNDGWLIEQIRNESYTLQVGNKRYELSNHLGNVLAVVSDKKVQTDGVTWSAIVISATDYYPFGMAMPGRSSGAYRYGFNGKETDPETGLNDFGARLYDNRLGRWLALDPLAQKYPAWSAYHFGFCSPIVTIDPNGKENIIVVGAQFDKGKGNKLMFLHHAIRQMKEYRKDYPKENASVLIMKHDYTDKQLAAFEEVAKKEGVQVIYVSTAEQVKNYLNSKSIDKPDLSMDRVFDPITKVDVFSHGTPRNIDLCYHQNGEVEANGKLTMDIAEKLDKDAFESNTTSRHVAVTLHTCRGGAGAELPNDELNRFRDMESATRVCESIAQRIADKAKVTVNAYTCRSDYKATLSNIEVKMPMIDGALFYKLGATQPVTSGSTPQGCTQGMRTYNPDTHPDLPRK